ncbi:MAG: ComEA family DNA-binding protein [Bacteroidota bacterium]
MRNRIGVILLLLAGKVYSQSPLEEIEFNSNAEDYLKINRAEQLIIENPDIVKINFANEEELLHSQLFTVDEIKSLIDYRKKYGYFNTLEELQVIDEFTIERLKKLKSYLDFELPVSTCKYINWKNSGGQITSRVVSPVFSKVGVQKNNYFGSLYRTALGINLFIGQNITFVYNGEKDGGEKFQVSNKQFGFDFNSFHLTCRNIRRIKKIVLGDYQIQLGQGLVIWQGMSLGKTSDIITIRKQEQGVKDYNGMSEFGFCRGIGWEYESKKIKIDNWISYNNADATIYQDTLMGSYFHSFRLDGMHRDSNEINSKNAVQLLSSGIRCGINCRLMRLCWNAVGTMMDHPINPAQDFYQYYENKGYTFFNQSISYDGTKKNFNYFGEWAMNENGSPAFVNGIIASIDKNISVSMLHRYYSKSYSSLYANGFSENTHVNNEHGFYSGLTYSYSKKIQVSLFYDLYKFPWLKFGINQPSEGNDYSMQLNYTPTKSTVIGVRFQHQEKQASIYNNERLQTYLTTNSTNTLRIQVKTEMNRWLITGRLDMNQLKNSTKENGLLCYLDVAYKPFLKPYTFSIRGSLFQSDSYNSRLYAYQSDLPGSYDLGVFYGTGEAIYAMVHYRVSRKFSIWMKGERFLKITQPADYKTGSAEYIVKAQASYRFGNR